MKRASTARNPRKDAPAGVDAYVASLPDGKRPAFKKLREAIRAAAPSAVEGFSWGMPAFKLNGRSMVCFAAWADHCSLYPMSAAVIRAHAADLGRYDTSKGTIRFPFGKPLSAALVRKIVRARIAEMRRVRK